MLIISSLVGNRRPFSNGEMFSLFLLIIIIFISLFLAILIASFTGKELESIPTLAFEIIINKLL